MSRTYSSPVVAVAEDKLWMGVRLLQRRERDLKREDNPDYVRELNECRETIQAFREALGS